MTYLVFQRRKATGYIFETRSFWLARLVGSMPGLGWCATFGGPVMTEEEYLWSEWYA